MFKYNDSYGIARPAFIVSDCVSSADHVALIILSVNGFKYFGYNGLGVFFLQRGSLRRDPAILLAAC